MPNALPERKRKFFFFPPSNYLRRYFQRAESAKEKKVGHVVGLLFSHPEGFHNEQGEFGLRN